MGKLTSDQKRHQVKSESSTRAQPLQLKRPRLTTLMTTAMRTRRRMVPSRTTLMNRSRRKTSLPSRQRSSRVLKESRKLLLPMMKITKKRKHRLMQPMLRGRKANVEPERLVNTCFRESCSFCYSLNCYTDHHHHERSPDASSVRTSWAGEVHAFCDLVYYANPNSWWND